MQKYEMEQRNKVKEDNSPVDALIQHASIIHRKL